MFTFLTALFLVFFTSICQSTDLIVPSPDYPNLSSAIIQAHANDVIILSSQTMVYDAVGANINFPIVIKGASSERENYVIDGAIHDALFFLNTSQDLTLENLTLTNFENTSPIIATTGQLLVNNCAFTNNHGFDAGIFAASNCRVTISNSRFEENTSEFSQHVFFEGGSIVFARNADLNISDSQFYYNQTIGIETCGGVVNCRDSNVIIGSCLFDNNKVGHDGGAIYIYNTDFLTNEIADCSFMNNISGVNGGAVSIGGRNGTIVGSKFSNNVSAENGGAIHALLNYSTIESDTLMGNSANAGGAIYLGGNCTQGFGARNVDKCIFNGNYANQGGAVYSIWDYPTRISDCSFRSNYVPRLSGTNGEGGGLYMREGDLVVNNCLFASNLAIDFDDYNFNGSAIYATTQTGRTSQLQLLNSTLSENGQTDSHQGTTIFIDDGVSIQFYSLNVAMNNDETPLRLSGLDDYLISYSNVFQPGWDNCEPNNLVQDHGMSLNPRFVENDLEFNLAWDSPLMDAGDPAHPADPVHPLDFDLTSPDIGWQPEFPEATLSGIVQNLPVGHYDITDDTEIRSAIPAGTVLRVSTGKSLTIVPDAARTITIGDADGARTALVGRPEVGLDPCSAIEIHAQGPPECTMNLQGVLFNYPPQNVLDPSFNGVTINLDDVSVSQDIDGRQVRFQNWIGIDQDMDDPSSPFVDGRLTFVYAQGRVHHLAVGDAANQGPGGLSLLKTNIDVEDCTFQITGTESAANTPPLLMYGACEVETPVLQRNTFVGSTQGNNYLADFQQTVLRLVRNRFEDLTYTPIIETHSSLDMSHEARNDLYANPTSFNPSSPLMELEYGDLDLYCGRNNFVVRDHGNDWPILRWPALPTEPHDDQVWRQNYWGTTCQLSISEDLLNDSRRHLLPYWASVEASLTNCVEPSDPDNPACPYEIYTAIELLKNGKLAEASLDYVAAKDNYRFLLALYPTSKEANEGSLRLKGLGLNKEYGPEGYADVAAGLFAAADTSEQAQMHQQAVLQDCGGWCVEARWGDRPGALAALSGMRSGETDPICRTTINKTVLEIGTFPVQGGTSALHPQALAARRVERQRAEQSLLTSPRGQAVELEQERGEGPSDFRIINVHPNPFNPVAILQLAVPADGLVRVRVFNLLGQQMAEPLNQHVQAGPHTLQIDGSRWASGLYVAVAEQDGHTSTQKMMLVK